jgi:hypothetical protein
MLQLAFQDPIEPVSARLSAALLPPNWPGRGYLGQVTGPSFWLTYRPDWLALNLGLRLTGHLEPSPGGCRLLGRWRPACSRRTALLMLSMGLLLGAEAVSQWLHAPLLFTTPWPDDLTLGILVGLGLLGVGLPLYWGYQTRRIQRFLYNTLAPVTRSPNAD